VRLIPLIALITWTAQGTCASAQVASGGENTVEVQGAVTPVCLLGSADRSDVAFGGLIDTVGVRVGRLSTLDTQQIQLPGSFCNYAGTRLTVAAHAMIADGGGAPPPGFARAVNFTAAVSGWTGADAQVTTTAGADGSTPTATGLGGVQPAPRSADLVLTLSDFSAPADAPLAAGGYSGWITITLGPDLAGEVAP
jgi:hypothetical protein